MKLKFCDREFLDMRVNCVVNSVRSKILRKGGRRTMIIHCSYAYFTAVSGSEFADPCRGAPVD